MRLAHLPRRLIFSDPLAPGDESAPTLHLVPTDVPAHAEEKKTDFSVDF
jgi:hypothetical protein